MRGWNICLFINFFVCFLAKGQHTVTTIPDAKLNAAYDTTPRIPNPRVLSNGSALIPFGSATIKTVPSTFYYNSIGFFCQKELQIEKALSFPVKFRLGSVAYTDQMEGKGKVILLTSNRK